MRNRATNTTEYQYGGKEIRIARIILYLWPERRKLQTMPNTRKIFRIQTSVINSNQVTYVINEFLHKYDNDNIKQRAYTLYSTL